MSNTLFTKVDYSLSALMSAIGSGQIGLPDIQRPFVWKNVKVRNLLDSMYRGYPIGSLLFWETGVQPGSRQIGQDAKQLAPTKVIVDGQQRLTSLYAVITGTNVVRENYDIEAIEIAFNPLEERFEVTDAAIRRNKAFIPNVSAVWSPNTNIIQFSADYIEGLKQARASLSPADVDKAQKAIGRLHALLHFPFSALELSTKVEPEQVSDVFVRINSEGKQLNQSDFILTLMSVFWDEGRTQLENFCRDARVPTKKHGSPYNYFIQPSPDQMLRVAIVVGFRRAKLSAVYSILRGRNADGGEDSATARDARFDILKRGQAIALNVQYWQDFLKAVVLAGYRAGNFISSQNALLYTYGLYLLGRTQFEVEEHALRKAIARWFFMVTLTGRYTSSPESQMEFDLASLRDVSGAQAFLQTLADVCDGALTNDYWSITLPSDLATSAARSPSMFAFFAAQSVIDAPVLYSVHKVRELIDPITSGSRSALERHHLFPAAYLKSNGFPSERDYNQTANFAFVEWGDNGDIGREPPTSYVPSIEGRFDAATLNAMYRAHALPQGWHELEYPKFLKERRSLMAAVIRDAYERLSADRASGTKTSPDVAALIAAGETAAVEFKSTLRTNMHTNERDPKMEATVLKTLGGFLNTTGGTLIIGAADDGTPVGVEVDGFPNEDKMSLHLINLLKDRLGGDSALYVQPRFDDYEGVRVLVVECQKAQRPVFVKDAGVERFFVRYGPSTQELSGTTAQEYIRQRFR